MQNYYLELSEEEAAGGSSHKFYAVIVDGCKVTITYGRIGTDGFASSQELATPEEAEKLALKKVGEKKKKGYGDAEKGVRKKRVITRRTLESRPSSSKKMRLFCGVFARVRVLLAFLWTHRAVGSAIKMGRFSNSATKPKCCNNFS
jgi:predicted DNA-binding WGR domain protein